MPSISEIDAVPYGTWEVLREGRGLAILAVGTMVLPAVQAAQRLASEGIEATVVNCRFLKPYDREVFERVVAEHSAVLTVEEGALVNGFGSFMAREIAEAVAGDDGTHDVRVRSLGIPDHFVEHGDRAGLLGEIGLDVEGITGRARELVGWAELAGKARGTA